MKELLKQHVCQAVFTKVDGSTRKMICTLKDEYITSVSAGASAPDPEDVITVWDVEAEAFRRIKPSRMLEELKVLS